MRVERRNEPAPHPDRVSAEAARGTRASRFSLISVPVNEFLAMSTPVTLRSLICAPVMSAVAPAESVDARTAVTTTAPTVMEVCENFIVCPDRREGTHCPDFVRLRRGHTSWRT